MRNWISVDEEKPKHLQQCFITYVFDDLEEVRFYGVARYICRDVNKAYFVNEGVDYMRVTHWMPIPELPKRGTD